jgi:hypothetical protein
MLRRWHKKRQSIIGALRKMDHIGRLDIQWEKKIVYYACYVKLFFVGTEKGIAKKRRNIFK